MWLDYRCDDLINLDAQAFLLPLALGRPQVSFHCMQRLSILKSVKTRRSHQKMFAQVGYDIYSDEDLLALDSAPESVAVAVAPPPGFLAQVQTTPATFCAHK